MRAVVVHEFGGIENASLGDVPKPSPKAGDVLLEVHAASVNFVDLVMMSGSYQFKPALPFVPGKLPVGVVAAVGDGVTKFKPGDHALADGGGRRLCRIRRDAGEPVHQAAAGAAVHGSRRDGADLRHRLFRAEGPRPHRARRNRAGAWRDRRRRPCRDPARQGDGRQACWPRVASKDKEDIVRAAGADAIDRPLGARPAREPAGAGVRADRQAAASTSSSTCWAATSSTPRCARSPGADGWS